MRSLSVKAFSFMFFLVVVMLSFSGVAIAGRGGGGGGHGGGGGGGCGGGGCGGDASLSTFETADFSGSGNCAFCHSALQDSFGTDVSIDSHWRSTMMANSGKDPLWQAKISSEVSRNPALAEVIEEKCSRCHMGMARYQAITDGLPVRVLGGSGFLDPDHSLHAAAMDGISCTLCHQIQHVALGTHDSFTGQYVIDTSTNPPYREAFGPYYQPVAHPMEMHSGFSPVQGSQVLDSGLCGSCHTLFTPTVDANGTVVGEFPEQMTYLEWEHALAGGGVSMSCQECHMPEAAGSVVISNRPHWLGARSPFGQHHFVGGNSFMVNLIKVNATAIGATADASHLDATIARTDSSLQTETASLSVVSASIDQNILSVTLDVRNDAGHKFPSGIPARRAWLHVTVKDSRGQTVFESGRPQADGSIEGNKADIDPAQYEPHYDLITSSGQVQIYEPVMLNTDGEVTYTLLRAATYAKDNRLLPAGFDKATAEADIATYGSAATDANFEAGEDEIVYEVDVYRKRKPLTVTAELLYQSVSYSFSQDLRQDSTIEVNRFVGFFDSADKSPKVVSQVQISVQ